MSGKGAEGPGRAAGLVRQVAVPLSTGVQFALVSSVAFSLSLLISAFIPYNTPDTAMIGAMWAMISAVVVMQDTRSSTISTAWLRIFGSLVGAAFSALYLTFFPFSIAGMGILVGIVAFACISLKIPGHLRLAALTVGIVMVISFENPAIPPLVNAATRFVEVVIGSSVAVGAALAWQYVFRSE